MQTKRLLRPKENNKGYWVYKLHLGASKELKQVYIHRIVYILFVGSIPKDKVINHIDHNKHNNSVENLECITQSENVEAWWDHKEKEA